MWCESVEEGRTKIRSVTCGDVIDGVDGLRSRRSLPMSSVLHPEEHRQRRKKDRIGLQDRLVDGVRGVPVCYCFMISPAHACRDLFIESSMNEWVRQERREAPSKRCRVPVWLNTAKSPCPCHVNYVMAAGPPSQSRDHKIWPKPRDRYAPLIPIIQLERIAACLNQNPTLPLNRKSSLHSTFDVFGTCACLGISSP